MKLQSINKIKNLRNIVSLEECSDFAKNNLIYATNGLGKTNITRLFECLSLPGNERDVRLSDLYPQEMKGEKAKKPEFELMFDNNKVISEKNMNQFNGSVLVFNSDYIQETIRSEFYEEAGDEEVEISMPVGKESVKFLNKNAELEEKKKEKEEKDTKLQNLFNKLKSSLEKKVKEFDANARSEKVEVEFSLENAIEKYEWYEADQKKKKEEYENVENNFRKIGNIKGEEFNQAFDPIKVNFNHIESLLKNKKNFEDPSNEVMNLVNTLSRGVIEKVVEQYATSNDEKCPVCLSEFGETQKRIFKEYSQYLKSQKAEFEKNIDEEIQTREENKLVIGKNGALTPKIKGYVEEGSSALNLPISYEELRDIQGDLDNVINLLKKKEANPNLSNLDISKSKENILNYNESIKKNNTSVQTIKDKIQQVSARKKELRMIYASKLNIRFFEENKKLISEIQQLKKAIDDFEVKLKELHENLPSGEIKEVIPRLFNKFLKTVGIDKYELVEKDQRFYLKLKTGNSGEILDFSKRTDKISEGERNALAFVYFLSSAVQKLKKATDFSNAIFILDDPICSMDYQYIYGICEVIGGYKERMKNELWQNEGTMENPQIILFTHNIKFFNLMYSHTWKDRRSKKLELVEKENSHKIEKVSEKISEYEKSIKALIQWKKDSDNFKQNNCNIVNDIRKIFDVLFVMHGTKERTVNKMKEILGKEIPEDMNIFMNDGSHLDMDETTDINKSDFGGKVDILLSTLNKKYPDLLKKLGYEAQDKEEGVE